MHKMYRTYARGTKYPAKHTRFKWLARLRVRWGKMRGRDMCLRKYWTR